MGLVKRLAEKQRALGMNDVAFAKHIGLSQPAWSLMRRGLRQPGRKTLRAITRLFPDLQTEALIFLHTTMTSGIEQATSGHDTPSQAPARSV